MSATSLAYPRFEIKRLFRNRQNLIFSLIFPLVMFYAIAAPQASTNISPKGLPPVSFGRFYFAGLLAFGSLAAIVSGGARISLERQIGWTRQLRLTPLPARAYLRSKIVTSYLVAILSMLALTAAALSVGVKFDAVDWLTGIGLSIVALIPFAAIGIFLGHMIKGDSMGPVIGGAMSLFSLVGGAYFPITGGVIHTIAKFIPSYWLVQGNKTGIGGEEWTAMSWLVVAVWAVVFGALAMWAYRRDTARI